MTICWERSAPLVFAGSVHISAVPAVDIFYPFDVLGKIWNSIESVPEHCFVLCFTK